ncbi:MAG: SWIM zinc finger family protein [Actinomycetes bacterium]
MSPRGIGSGQPWWAEERGPNHRKPAARGAGARRGFGSTWWGKAWVQALEQRAALDPNRLPRGRSYARSGRVLEMDVVPGQVRAQVQGSRRKPYSVHVRVRQFSAPEWARVLDAVAAQIGRTAALLDGELPPELVDDVASAGLSLLPGAGEVQPRCSCPDWADPCKHSAAVCYLVADELDADPFALLRLRGRDRDDVLAGLRARRGGTGRDGGTSAALAPSTGMPVKQAFARDVAPLPPVPLPPQRPGRPAVLPVEPPGSSGIETGSLAVLAADAVTRAWEVLLGDCGDGLPLDTESDLARRAAGALGPGSTVGISEMARRAEIPPRQLTSWGLAWRHSGQDGLAVLREPWRPTPDELDDGRAALEALEGTGRVVAQQNRLTRGRVQLRLGQDGLWYRFEKSGTASTATWDLAAPPAADPSALLPPT